MKPILAIDPGPERSAYVGLQNGVPQFAYIWENREIIHAAIPTDYYTLVIESVESYGMPVGKTTFETCYWIGRFWQKWVSHSIRSEVELVSRKQVKLHLCGTARAKDSNVRQALIDRFGPGKAKAIGLKKSPGPLYGFKSHLWSALAVGVTYYDQVRDLREAR